MRHLLLIVLFPLFASAQDQLAETHVAVFFHSHVDKELRMELLKTHGLVDAGVVSEFRYKPYVILPIGEVNTDALVSEPAVEYISPVHTNAEHRFVTYRSNLFVKLKNGSDVGILQREADRLGIELVGPDRFTPSIIELRVNKFSMNTIEAVAALRATGSFATVSPNLVHSVADCSVNDPRFNRQWHLKNDGSSIQGNGVIGADMDVEAAWAITTGSADITIAIIDSGVDTLHPELLGKLLPGFDAMGDSTNGYPTPNFSSDGHGTACAGIAAASTDNNIGVAGVCQDCKVVPVRVFNYEVILGEVQPWSETQFFLNAMGWQAQADIDVSSNSWAVPDILLALYPGSDTLVNAVIDEVVENARGGLGVPMLFSSGNDGITDTIPLWPARYDKTIAVGATSMCDEHKTPTSCDGESWWAGNWGEGLDVSAPGVRITTIDMLGTNGFHSTEYYNTFNGTSAACPNAAGTMGLILSHTPDLPQWLARKVLALTCEKVGGYDYSTWKEAGNWSYELGYGRINAYQAVTYGASAVGDLPPNGDLVVETHADAHVIRTSGNAVRTWQLFDINGRMVRAGTASGELRVAHSGLSTGIYALRMEGGKQYDTLKLLIP